jgi:hypothetical protein
VPDPRKEVLPVRLPNTSTRDIRMLNASLAVWRHGKKQGTQSSFQDEATYLLCLKKWRVFYFTGILINDILET